MDQLCLSNLKEVVIFGASRGIGEACLRDLCRKGVPKVHLVARNKERLQKLRAEYSDCPTEIFLHGCDLAQQDAVEKLFHYFEDAGPYPRHWIFTVGGFPGGHFQKNNFENLNWEDIRQTLELNFEIPMRLTLKILPELLREKTPASLIYLSSQAGFHPRPGLIPYASSKFALNGFAKSLFAELQQTLVKVCLVAPSFVETSLIPESPNLDRSKMIRPEDVATSISWALETSKQCCPLEMHLMCQQNPVSY